MIYSLSVTMARDNVHDCGYLSIGEFESEISGKVFHGTSRLCDNDEEHYHFMVSDSTEHVRGCIIVVAGTLRDLKNGCLQGISYSNKKTGNYMYIDSFLMYHILDQCMDGDVFDYRIMIEVVEDIATRHRGYDYEGGELHVGVCLFNDGVKCRHEFCSGNEYTNVDELLTCVNIKSARK